MRISLILAFLICGTAHADQQVYYCVTERAVAVKRTALVETGPLKFKIALDDKTKTIEVSQGALSRGKVILSGDVFLSPNVVALANNQLGISLSFLPPWLHATEIASGYDSVRSFSAKCDPF